MFDQIIGNEKVKYYLTQLAKRESGNSLLFAGPDGIGKTLFAEAFAKLLIGKKEIEVSNHPDIRIYRPEGKIGMHSIASMREFSEEVFLAPFEARWKIFIIHEAERMLSYSANALLKTFEEPALDSIIILLSSHPSALLPTVLSRCKTVRFHPLAPEDIVRYLMQRHQKSAEEAKTVAAMAQGSIGRAVRLIQGGSNPLRKVLLEFLSTHETASYRLISDAAALLAEQIEAAKSGAEAEARRALLHAAGENLSAIQKQGLEKEVEGILSLLAVREMHALFEALFSWYRDMHLLHLNGNRALLLNPDYQEACSRALEKGKLLQLEKVEKAISEARLALERSTTPQICLEGLFLKLLTNNMD